VPGVAVAAIITDLPSVLPLNNSFVYAMMAP